MNVNHFRHEIRSELTVRFFVSQQKPTGGSSARSSDNDSTNNNMEVIFVGQSSGANNNYIPMNAHTTVDNELNSCKTLQRKLELKVERAKRNFSQRSGAIERKPVRDRRLHSPIEIELIVVSRFLFQFEKSNTMIPISRLPIPRYQESVPLVEYKSEIRWISTSSEEGWG